MSEINSDSQLDLKSGEKEILLDHNYDGIHELDHVLPKWWLGILYATIVFAFGYVTYFMILSGPSPSQELRVRMTEIEAMRPKPPADGGTANNAALVAALKDPAKLTLGREVFNGKCLACHADKGQGLIGPNLTDDFWITGKGTLAEIATVVNQGVLEKGMPAWNAVLSPDEITNVVAFVRSIRGTNPAGAKPPQGEKAEVKDEL